jgi:hypothetical protein
VHRELIFPKPDISILDVIPKGSEVKGMLQCGGIWFAGGKFGITWKAYQMIVKPKHQLLPGVCHISINVAEAKVEAKELPSEMIDSDEDPEKEYAPPPPPALARSLSEPGETGEPVEMTSNAPDVPEVPVKGRKKVVKS